MSDTTTAEAAAEVPADPLPERADTRPDPAPWPLHVLGTPSRRGAALAAAVWQALSGAGRVTAGGPSADFPPTPGARHIVFVDSPAAAVASALQSVGGRPIEVVELIDAWATEAQRLLRVLIQQPMHCLCIDVAEALQKPDALWTAIADWEPVLELAIVPDVPRSDDDALSFLLADAATRNVANATRLFEELRATSTVLAEDTATAPAQLAPSALASYAALHGKLAQASESLRQAQLERDTQRRDNEDLLVQLHQLQAEWECTFLKCKHHEERLAEAGTSQAEIVRQLAELQKRHSALQAARDVQAKLATDRARALQEAERAAEAERGQARQAESAARQERDEARQALARVEQERDVARRSLASVEQELDARRLDAEALLATLHELQEALESSLLEARALERRRADDGAERAETARQLGELQKQFVALQAERDAQARLAKERAAALQLAEAAKSKAADDNSRLTALLAEADKVRGAAEKSRSLLLAQRESMSLRLEQVTAQRDAEARLADELTKQVEALQGQLTDIDAERTQLADVVAALEDKLAETLAAAATASAERGELARAVLDLRSEQTELQGVLQAERDERNRLDVMLVELQADTGERLDRLQHELRAALETLDQERGQRRALDDELAVQRAHAAESAALLQAERRDRDRLMQSLDDLVSQRDRGVAELNSVRITLADVQAQQQRHAAELAAQLAQVDEQRSSLQQRLDSQAADIQRHLARGKELQTRVEQQAARITELDAQGRRQREQQSQTEAQLVQAGQQLRRAQQEHALLAGQMGRMHQELQRYETRRQREGRPAPVTVAQVEIGAQRMEAPYRDLACALRELRIDEHEVPLLELRLVEHHGHPGLVLLDGPTPGAGIGGFERSGEEDGRGFMLLVPEDQPTRHMLARLGTHDWRLILGALAAVDAALVLPEAEPLLYWRGVLRRLRAQLDDQPARLRYDTLDVAAQSDQTLRLDFRRALFGERLFAALAVRWAPGARGSTVGQPPTLLLGEPDDAGPPLLAWPTDGQGRPLDEWQLPLGSAIPTTERQARWRALPVRDRELLLALLDALPAAAERLAEAGSLPQGHDRGSLMAAATYWLPEARRVLDPIFPLRRAARKLGRIMRSAA